VVRVIEGLDEMPEDSENVLIIHRRFVEPAPDCPSDPPFAQQLAGQERDTHGAAETSLPRAPKAAMAASIVG
jgi:hypothetical protein